VIGPCICTTVGAAGVSIDGMSSSKAVLASLWPSGGPWCAPATQAQGKCA
jgi:hypothetical protein